MSDNTTIWNHDGITCYFHELQIPKELPYDNFQHHICFTCRLRLVALARANFQFEFSGETVAISIIAEMVREKGSGPPIRDSDTLKRTSNCNTRNCNIEEKGAYTQNCHIYELKK